MDNLAAAIPFSNLMGVEITEALPDRVTGTLRVRADLCTLGGSIHGGAVMAFADTLGATGAFLNLPEGATGTTTVESKTNFLGGAAEGTTVVGVSTPVAIGGILSLRLFLMASPHRQRTSTRCRTMSGRAAPRCRRAGAHPGRS